jgi:hypothetical protein
LVPIFKQQTEELKMNSGFLAFIIPMTGGPVDPGYGVPGWPTHPIAPGGKPPSVWPGPGRPTHPIAPGGKPPGIWGGGNEPFPTPPIAPGGAPPSIWGDINVPAHPIVLPPGTEKPPPGIWHEPIVPPGFWGGVPPLWLWGDPIYPAEPPQIIDWHAGWSEETGWVIVGVPNVPAPTPSAKK